MSPNALPRAAAVLESGIDRGLHLGAQGYVWYAGETVADFAVGEARAGVPMTTGSMVTWFSMTKPTVAVAVAQQWERGALAPDDPVARYVPEFAQHGKEGITLRHLLTHTAGIRAGDQVTSRAAIPAYWDEIVAGICAVEREEGWEPGQRAGYHLSCGMTMLAEVVRRVDGRPFEQYVREEVFVPLGMDDCWVGMPKERHAAYGERIGTMHNTQGEAPVALDELDGDDVMVRCSPGGGGRGPMRELARLYRALLAGGELGGVRVLSPQTVAAITARHRVGLFDETFHCQCDWGLGFAVDNFAMGRHASPRAFGHGGALSAYAFADPDHDLVVVLQTNGMCASDDHYHRLDDVMTAISVDLELVPEGAEGRDKPMPQLGL
jgi:CubicO group peptidase (beta-lactamase class C family)